MREETESDAETRKIVELPKFNEQSEMSPETEPFRSSLKFNELGTAEKSMLKSYM
jgi:hypothetical protein